MDRTPVCEGAQKHNINKNNRNKHTENILSQTVEWKQWSKKDKNYYFHVGSFYNFLCALFSRFHSIFIFISLFCRLFRSLICYFNDYYCCCCAHYSYYYEIHRLILIFFFICFRHFEATLSFVCLCDASMHFTHRFLRFFSRSLSISPFALTSASSSFYGAYGLGGYLCWRHR